jgi:signal transduction histidine kinase/ActR/RegA family two-component response regulator
MVVLLFYNVEREASLRSGGVHGTADGGSRAVDLVGDRHQLLRIGMAAVLVASLVFGAVRLLTQLATARPTPWWANVGGAVVIVLLYGWYRLDPARRSAVGVHGTALTATVTLVVPSFYGMVSSKWWLALVGFGVTLMGRRREAMFWATATLILVPTVALVEPRGAASALSIAMRSSEPPLEAAMAAFFFVAVLLGVTWSFRRVAERRARSLGQMSESLAHANQVKTRFLAHVSHEVRTPLHTVIAMTDLALRGELSALARDQVDTIRASARTLMALLNNILDLTRVESQVIALEQRPFSLHQALSEILAPLAAQGRADGLMFIARAGEGLVEERVGDRVRVCQIVVNLVGNALKFTEKGSVRVELRAVSEDPDLVVIAITDTGRGIDPAKLETIFEPFVQMAREDAQRRAGVGLGLAIVKELARQMDGQVTVTSTMGRGSCFTVRLRLPRLHADGSPGPMDLLARPHLTPPVALPPVAPGRPLEILVCEDNEWVQKVFRMTLTRLGHHMTMTSDGREAWQVLTRSTKAFDVLVTDLDMPGMDGVELTTAIRQRDRTVGRHLPIVAVTGHSGGQEEARLLQAGADAFLAKPFDLADLSAALKDALDRGAASTAAIRGLPLRSRS